MCECLEPRADYYAEIVLHNNGLMKDVEYISRYSLKSMLVEAYKQGHKDANTFICYDRLCRDRLIVDELEEETD